MKQITLVALGGATGTVLRYLISVWAGKHFSGAFPLSTFFINITGCLIIGFLMGLSDHYHLLGNDLKILLVVGFCGGYTTFSTFSAENLRLFEMGNYMLFFTYIAGSVLLGLLAVMGGNFLSKSIG